ncbi:ankyrin repeat-containing domain protein [Xylaria scruposa]|nr:ankyrin repeat-containing domain protein [Xylaria scruposa]
MMDLPPAEQGNYGFDNGGNVNEDQCRCDSRSLELATASGEIERVNILIDSCTNVNHQREHFGHALQTAAVFSNMEMIDFLINKGADLNQSDFAGYGSVLQAAAGSGNLEMAEFLVDKGADINQSSFGAYGSPLQVAASSGKLEMARFLVDKGADVNQQGGQYGSALQIAASSGDLEIARFLVDKGADINHHGGDHGSALQIAVSSGDLEMAKFLVDKGADVNHHSRDHGSALQIAVSSGDLEMAKFLVDKDANVYLQNGFQMTALHYAVRRKEAEIVKFLLGKNAYPDAQNDTGATPLDLAIQLRNTEIIQLLLPKMESAPFLSTKSWRSALHLESAEALMFTFRGHLSVEPVEVSVIPPFMRDDEKAVRICYFLCQPDTTGKIDVADIARMGFMDLIPKHLVHIVCDNGMPHFISPTSTFRCRWWRSNPRELVPSRGPEASLLPNPDLCGQLDSREFLIENWFTMSCLTITDNNWPSQQTPIPETYNQLEQVEGFFCAVAKRPKDGFTGGSSTEKPLRPVFSVTTCGDTSVKLIESIEDLITPLIEKLDRTFEKNNLEAGRQLSNARLDVLRNGGRSEGLLPRLLSDATVIEYMTENHAHIVRSLTGLIDYVAKLQDGPWKLSEQAEKDCREKIKSLKAHRETLRELLERSQNIIQLEFNLASILEARRSTSTNRSLKRLTWVTFVFLPLVFVASLFGMNVDILSRDPSWWWYFPIAGGFLLLTFGVWIIFKRFNTLEGSLERYFAWLTGDGIPAEVKHPTRNRDRRGSDRWANLKKFV